VLENSFENAPSNRYWLQEPEDSDTDLTFEPIAIPDVDNSRVMERPVGVRFHPHLSLPDRVNLGDPKNKLFPASIYIGAIMKLIRATICDEFSLSYVATSVRSTAITGSPADAVGIMEINMYFERCCNRI
jgi:hypothetical protein